MALVTPLKGILYNPEKIASSADVTTPPYDVISPDEQTTFYDRHPNNVIRLILGKSQPADTATDNPHTRSADYFRQWRKDGILFQEERPALYLKAISYSHEGETITRSEIFRYRQTGMDSTGKVIGSFEPTGIVPKFFEEIRELGFKLPMDIF